MFRLSILVLAGVLIASPTRAQAPAQAPNTEDFERLFARAMDAAGLRAESEQAKIRDQVNAAGNRGILTGYASNSANDEPLSKALEKNEDVLRQDPRNGLGELARSTGGLAFDNTNNLRQGFDRVESDQKNYYLLGYTPINENFDGHFRAIEVKVKRPGVTVAARKGYFAVRDPGTGGPVNSYEAPALGALEQKPVPNAFPVHVRHRQGMTREAKRRFRGLRPGVGFRQTLGRMAGVERQHLRDVGRQLHRAIDDVGRADRRQPPFTDEHHPDELPAPGVARQDVRWRKRVTRAAHRARLLLIAARRRRLRRWLLRGHHRGRSLFDSSEDQHAAQRDGDRGRVAGV